MGHETNRFTFALKLDKSGDKSSLGEWKPFGPQIHPNAAVVQQSLHIDRVILGQAAKENELNLVSVEVEDPESPEKYHRACFPLAYLTKGRDYQAQVSLDFPIHYGQDLTVKFELTEGSGPVHIIGYHLYEPIPAEYPDSEAEAEEDTTEEDEPVDENQKEEVVAKRIISRPKRRIINNEQNGDAEVETKKIKVAGKENGDAKEATDDDMEAESKWSRSHLFLLESLYSVYLCLIS